MPTQDIRVNGKIMGQIRTLSETKHELRDAHGKVKGTYNPKTNETRDERGKLVGNGNLLPMMLK